LIAKVSVIELRQQGYKTAFFGKWNVGPDGPDDLRGFDLGMSIDPTEQVRFIRLFEDGY